MEGESDVQGKAVWTAERGALFLANIADTEQRCSKTIEDGTPDEDLDKCHDASDDVLRNPQYLAPLRTLPAAELSSQATGTIHVTGEGAGDKVRIFVKSGSAWEFVGANHTFTASELQDGLELGIDARDVRRPGIWDGRATVHFSIADGDDTASDEVALRVAPVLTHHHLQEAQRVFTTYGQGVSTQEAFIADLKNNTADAGISLPVFEFEWDFDIWTQDFFEPGYASIPGPDGPIVLRIMIRSSQSRRAGRQVFQYLRSENVGAVQFFPLRGGTIDSTGNLETIPPYTHDGVSYPAGRVIMGSFGEEKPVIFPFLEAQETQVPLELDTSWLFVGHVDEFFQFLPADNERGWVLVADDPMKGIATLKNASEAGFGSEPAFSRPKLPSDGNLCVPTTTIDDELARDKMLSRNEVAAERIKANIDIIKRETGLTDDEIIRVPAIFYEFDYDMGGNCGISTAMGRVSSATDNAQSAPLNIVEAAGARDGKLKGRQTQVDPVVAHYPGVVNGVVMSDSYYLAPNPWGPIIDGEDIFAVQVVEAYQKANYNVTFMDDYFSHHVLAGEIHCGSNTWRDAKAPWW